jgi:hypothetical protein
MEDLPAATQMDSDSADSKGVQSIIPIISKLKEETLSMTNLVSIDELTEQLSGVSLLKENAFKYESSHYDLPITNGEVVRLMSLNAIYEREIAAYEKAVVTITNIYELELKQLRHQLNTYHKQLQLQRELLAKCYAQDPLKNEVAYPYSNV